MSKTSASFQAALGTGDQQSPQDAGIANYYEITEGTYETGAANVTTASAKTQAGVKGGIDEGIVALRLQDQFSDGIRGLDTYGMKIIAQDELQCVKIPA